MWIIGVDYHPSVQQIAFVNNDTGECGERRLSHSDGEAEKFYCELKAAGCKVRVGMEATGHARWFKRLLAELGFELWIGDPARIKASGCESRRRTAWMPHCCCNCCWKIAFLGCGYPVRKIEICVSYCGIAIGWYRCARGS